ncbi:MAG TPA: DNA gyrase inhibitor YacG [Gammaproteobacteria bacterium]|nr:DNA gyrase inhibitor YacG [Gammaproteobacteria bacterium]
MKPFTVHCPTCAAPVAWNADAPWRPFCSRRCRLIDLGQWAGEEHRIPGPPAPTDPLDDPAEA